MKFLLRLVLVAVAFYGLTSGQSPKNAEAQTFTKSVEQVQVASPEQPQKEQAGTQETPQVEARQTVQPQPVSSREQMMTTAGIPQSDWAAVDYIISHESSWRHDVWNSTGSGAYGLCQSLPASKMASAGADYLTNPVTQLKWCHKYAQSRYGGWWNAQAFWSSKSWW